MVRGHSTFLDKQSGISKTQRKKKKKRKGKGTRGKWGGKRVHRERKDGKVLASIRTKEVITGR